MEPEEAVEYRGHRITRVLIDVGSSGPRSPGPDAGMRFEISRVVKGRWKPMNFAATLEDAYAKIDTTAHRLAVRRNKKT